MKWGLRTYLLAAEEDTQHLFLTSECARAVWKRFGDSSVLQMVQLWSPLVQKFTQFTTVRTSTCFLVLHEIWKGRCRTVFEGKRMSARSIISKVKYHLQLLDFNYQPKKKSSYREVTIIERLGLAVTDVRARLGIWCKRKQPEAGYYKLNVDGSSKDGICSGCGVIRDDTGWFIAAFSTYYGLVPIIKENLWLW
ncbi:hypothetical protein ACP275_07G090000 [Erythranthe tilingii]